MIQLLDFLITPKVCSIYECYLENDNNLRIPCSVIKNPISFVGCCGQDGDNSVTHLCFLQMDVPHYNVQSLAIPNNPNTPKPNITSDSVDESVSLPQPIPEKLVQNHTTYCLPAQPVVAQANLRLNDEGEQIIFYGSGRCYGPQYRCPSTKESSSTIKSDQLDDGIERDGINSSNHCFLPRLVRDLERFRIVQIFRRQHESKEPVLFVGNVMDLYNGLRTTDYVPRSWLLSRIFGFSFFSKFPEKLETVLLLTAGLSAGLAVVNMLPIYGLDGYHIVDALVRAAFAKKLGWEGRRISRIVQFISWMALIIAFLTIFCSVAQSL
jgi:hypothetical protein